MSDSPYRVDNSPAEGEDIVCGVCGSYLLLDGTCPTAARHDEMLSVKRERAIRTVATVIEGLIAEPDARWLAEPIVDALRSGNE